MTVIKPSFYRFSALNKDLINIDYHIHTRWTDGNNTADEVIKAAESLNIREIAFTEHIRKDSTYFPEFYKEIADIRQRTNVKVHIGVETKVMDNMGNIDLSESNYLLAEIVSGSVHRVHNMMGDCCDLKELDKEKAFRLEFEYTQALVKKNKIDVLSHPGGMSYKHFGEIPEFFIKETIKLISESEIAFEINSKYMNDTILDTVLYYCKKYDPYISIGSDVHHVSELGNCKEVLGKYL